MSEEKPGWHWRNCRRLSVIFHLRVWPFLSAGAERIDNVYGGDMWLWWGPFEIGLQYDHGNCSCDGVSGWLALSEIDAYSRACKYEGIEA